MKREQIMTQGPPNVTDPGRVIAHRGASKIAPENTLAAFRMADRLGAFWLEFDVSLLGDATPVIHHDATFDRCTDQTGALSGADRAALATINAGAAHGATFEPLPTLGAALDLIDELELYANLEMKPHDGRTGDLAKVVADALARRPWTRQRIITSSFILPELKAFRAHAPDAPIAVLYEAPPKDWTDQLAALNAAALHLNFRHLTQTILRDATSRGLDVRVYTINTPSVMTPFREHGLTSVITDHPPLFLDEPDWAEWAKT